MARADPQQHHAARRTARLLQVLHRYFEIICIHDGIIDASDTAAVVTARCRDLLTNPPPPWRLRPYGWSRETAIGGR